MSNVYCGEKHHLWKGGRHISNKYWAVRCPGHPKAHKNYVYEHVLIAEKKLGRYLLPGECIHHIDNNELNNSEDNLRVFKSNAEHVKFHHTLITWSKHYDKCKECGTTERRHEGYGYCSRCYQRNSKNRCRGYLRDNQQKGD
jgi:hypothetical protein